MLPRVVAAHRVVALVVAVVCLPAPRAAPLPPAARAAWAPTPPLVRADASVCALVRSGRSHGQFVHCCARSGRRAVPLDVAPDARGKGSPPWLCGSDRTGPVERRAVLAHATQRWAAAAFLFAAPLAGRPTVTAAPLPFGREVFSASFNATKGPLGLGLQELRVPLDGQGAGPNEVLIISSVDGAGQGVRQERRLRPGLVVKAVQGRELAGLDAAQALELLQDTFQAAAGSRAPIVAVTFSSECVSVPTEPDFCFNAVASEDSVLGVGAWGEGGAGVGERESPGPGEGGGGGAATQAPQTNDDIFRPPRGWKLSPNYGLNTL